MAKVECTCLQCGKMFKARPTEINKGRGNYCTRECSNKARRMHTTSRICKQCKRPFERREDERPRFFNKRVYCSVECRSRSISEANILPPNANCEQCGKPFRAEAYNVARGHDRYCSPDCAVTARRQYPKSAVCKYCGCNFQYNSSSSGKYCSLKCSYLSHRGEKSVLWRGGNKIKYYGPDWYSQREAAYKRDGGVCQYCYHKPNKNESSNHVHHIRKFREFNGDYIAANDLSNLITLCPQCHAKAERGKIAVPVRLL